MSTTNGYGDRPSSQGTIDDDTAQNQIAVKEESTPAKRSDPMSFSNILSDNAPEPPKSTPRALPASRVFKNSSSAPNGDGKSASAAPRKMSKAASSKASPAPSKNAAKVGPDPRGGATFTSKAAGALKRKPPVISEKDNEQVKAEMAKIDAMELSDIESPEYDAAKYIFAQSRPKRQLDVEAAEMPKRKVSPVNSVHRSNVLQLTIIASMDRQHQTLFFATRNPG